MIGVVVQGVAPVSKAAFSSNVIFSIISVMVSMLQVFLIYPFHPLDIRWFCGFVVLGDLGSSRI